MASGLCSVASRAGGVNEDMKNEADEQLHKLLPFLPMSGLIPVLIVLG